VSINKIELSSKIKKCMCSFCDKSNLNNRYFTECVNKKFYNNEIQKMTLHNLAHLLVTTDIIMLLMNENNNDYQVIDNNKLVHLYCNLEDIVVQKSKIP